MKRIMITVSAVLIALVLAAGCAKKESSKAEPAMSAAAGLMPEMVICSIDSTGQVQMSDTDSIPKLEYKGKIYYFSSEACRDIIVSNPEKYLGPGSQ